MTFQNPVFLQVGVGLAILAALAVWRHADRRRLLAQSLGGRRAATRLSGSNLYRFRLERVLLLGAGALALAIAGAEPRWPEGPPEPAPPPVRNVVLAIDVSASMQATDTPPTRLAEGVALARELLGALERDRVGLLLFAGGAYSLAPPTHDHAALAYLLEGVTPTIASAHDPGTLLSVAIEEGVALLAGEGEAAPEGERAIILIGDGEAGEPAAAVEAAVRAAAEAGVTVHAIGVGTPEGAGMVMPEAPFQLERRIVDAAGAPATSRLDEATFRRIAELGSGVYAHAAEPARLDEVHRAVATPAREAPTDEPPPSRAGGDLTFWFAAVALVLLLLESLLDVRGFALRPASVRRPA